jgi:hypothetical protein
MDFSHACHDFSQTHFHSRHAPGGPSFPSIQNSRRHIGRWTITVLLIAAHAGFDPHAAFPGDFDVSTRAILRSRG